MQIRHSFNRNFYPSQIEERLSSLPTDGGTSFIPAHFSAACSKKLIWETGGKREKKLPSRSESTKILHQSERRRVHEWNYLSEQANHRLAPENLFCGGSVLCIVELPKWQFTTMLMFRILAGISFMCEKNQTAGGEARDERGLHLYLQVLLIRRSIGRMNAQ